VIRSLFIYIFILGFWRDRLDGQKLMPRVPEIWGSNPGPAKFDKRCKRFATVSTSTQVAVLSWRYDVEIGTANSLHASAYYGEYKDKV